MIRNVLKFTVVGALVLVAVSACTAMSAHPSTPAGSSVSASPVPSPTPTLTGDGKILTATEAKSALPTARQVGDGWVVGSFAKGGSAGGGTTGNPNTATFSPSECKLVMLDNFKSVVGTPLKSERVTHASSDYRMPGNDVDNFGTGPFSITVDVSSYSVSAPTAGIHEATRLLPKCEHVKALASGEEADFTASNISVLKFGDARFASSSTLSASALTLATDSVYFVVGHNLIYITVDGYATASKNLAARVAYFTAKNLTGAVTRK